MKHIVSISYTSSSSNFDIRFSFQGRDFRLSHYGADFDAQIMRDLITSFDGRADVIALQGIHPSARLGKKTYFHRESEVILNLAKQTRVVTGDLMRSTYIPWALRAFMRKNPGFFAYKKIAFYSGILDHFFIPSLQEETERMSFFDPFLHWGVHRELRGVESLKTYMKWALPFLQRRPLDLQIRDPQNRVHLNDLEPADIFVGHMTVVERFHLDHLRGKTLLLDNLTPVFEKHLRDAGVKNVLHFRPPIPGIDPSLPLSFAIIEAIFQALKDDFDPLTADEILDWILKLKLQPQLSTYSAPDRGKAKKFAFIIHPLSVDLLFVHPFLRPFRKALKRIDTQIENTMSLVPPQLYGKITGIKSVETGEETEGLIYALFDTPKVMMRKPAEATYERLVSVATMAAAANAEIIGLGAYTKIVGDAGVTVAKLSPIPVTTGNSLSASATLWAARDACAKLGFLKAYKRGERIDGKCLIIGATGSIGAVCAKILAQVFNEVILCSRTPDRLLELKGEIEEINPNIKIQLVTNPNPCARQADLIVTSTSSHDKRVLDIMQVKPGCVICDVSRPLDVREEDAIKRPDVLVVESGEIELPGDVKLSCDIGLPESIVYACLAETALLALEGRAETFTLSRHINFLKVQEIYDIAKKHGAKLAKIRGHAGTITDAEIALCREHALKALKTWKASG